MQIQLPIWVKDYQLLGNVAIVALLLLALWLGERVLQQIIPPYRLRFYKGNALVWSGGAICMALILMVISATLPIITVAAAGMLLMLAAGLVLRALPYQRKYRQLVTQGIMVDGVIDQITTYSCCWLILKSGR